MFRLAATRLAAAAMAALWLPVPAVAQFAGDAFFATPSVAVVEGGTGVLDLSFFSAAEPFGAAQMTLTFDPDDLEVVDVTLPPNPAAELRQEYLLGGGELRLVVVNTSSADTPVGTVELARVTVHPLAAAGAVIPVHAVQNGALTAGALAYASSGATGAEIVVTAPQSSTTVHRRHDAGQDLTQRAANLVPPGGQVELMAHNHDDTASPVPVQTEPSAGPGASDWTP